MSYKPLTESQLREAGRIGETAIGQLRTNPLQLPEPDEEGSVYFPYQTDVSGLGGELYLPIGELVASEETEEFAQLSIYHSKGYKNVASILNDKKSGLIHTRQLLQDIEVGYLQTQLDEEGEISEGELPTVVSGRHRLVAILTGYAFSKVPVKELSDVLIRVVPKIFASKDAMLAYIEAANGSRSMSRTEHVNIAVGLKEVDTDDIDNIIEYAISKTAGNVSDAFRLAFVFLGRHQGEKIGKQAIKKLPMQLELHTLGTIGSTVGTRLKKISRITKLLYTDAKFIAKVLLLSWEQLIEYLNNPEDTNIARTASSVVAPYVASHVWEELEAELPEPEEEPEDEPKPKRGRKTSQTKAEEAGVAEPIDTQVVVEDKPKRTRTAKAKVETDNVVPLEPKQRQRRAK